MGIIKIVRNTAIIFAILACSCAKPYSVDENNHAPIFTYTSTAMADTVYVEPVYTDTLHAIDPDGDRLLFGFTPAFDSLSIRDSIISWRPCAKDTGNKIITVVAGDGRYGSAILSWQVHVEVPLSYIRRLGATAFEQVVAEVEAFRGRKFLRAVTPVIFTRSGYSAQVFAGTTPPEEKQRVNRILTAEGFLRAGDDYFGSSDTMQATLVQGYYKWGTDSVWIIFDDGQVEVTDSDRLTIYHELLHAQQDQYVGLDVLFAAVQSSDQFFAVDYTVEGEATAISMCYDHKLSVGYYPQYSSTMTDYFQWYASSVSSYLDLLRSQGKRMYVYMPALIGYYSYGPSFIYRVIGSSSISTANWTKINNIYTNMPVKAREVMHPDTYLNQNRSLYRMSLTGFSDTAKAQGYTVFDYDEFGEVLGATLLREWGVSSYYTSVYGLLSDKAVVVGDSAGDTLTFCWVTKWSTAGSAKSFLDCYRALLSGKYAISLPPLTFPSAAIDTCYAQVTLPRPVYAEQVGDRTVIMENYPAAHFSEWRGLLRTASVGPWSTVAKMKWQELPRVEKTRRKGIIY